MTAAHCVYNHQFSALASYAVFVPDYDDPNGATFKAYNENKQAQYCTVHPAGCYVLNFGVVHEKYVNPPASATYDYNWDIVSVYNGAIFFRSTCID